MPRPISLIVPILLLGGCATAPAGPPVAPCKTYCGSFEEGYQWAHAGNLSTEAACDGYTEAFERGCVQAVSDLNELRPAREGLR